MAESPELDLTATVNGAWIRLRFSDHWSCKPVAWNCLGIVDESALRVLRQEVRHELLAKVQKHDAWQLLRAIPFIGPIRAALLIAWIQTPHRFRARRQLWTYSGYGIETYSSAEQHFVQGELQRVTVRPEIFGSRIITLLHIPS